MEGSAFCHNSLLYNMHAYEHMWARRPYLKVERPSGKQKEACVPLGAAWSSSRRATAAAVWV